MRKFKENPKSILLYLNWNYIVIIIFQKKKTEWKEKKRKQMKRW